jgi:hypothetical protein
MMLPIFYAWKLWTGALMAGAALGWWSWQWPLLLFFGPDLVGFVLLVLAAYEGRRRRKAAARMRRAPTA